MTCKNCAYGPISHCMNDSETPLSFDCYITHVIRRQVNKNIFESQLVRVARNRAQRFQDQGVYSHLYSAHRLQTDYLAYVNRAELDPEDLEGFNLRSTLLDMNMDGHTYSLIVELLTSPTWANRYLTTYWKARIRVEYLEAQGA